MIIRILLKTLVRRFFRQNAGQLIFIFILFFGAVGELEGKSQYTGPLFQLHYQYALILGMLSSRIFMGLVWLAWFVYAEKCTRFVLAALQEKDHNFLQLLNSLPRRRLAGLFFRIHLLLFLPIIIYSWAVFAVAIYKGWFLSGIAVIAYLAILCAIAAARSVHQLSHPARRSRTLLYAFFPPAAAAAYWKFFLQYALRQQRMVLAGIKLISCAVLFFSIRTLTTEYYDIRMPALLFGIAIFGHSVLIYRFREWEESRLRFFRSLPLSQTRRFGQYAILYGLLLFPEIILLAALTPGYLHRSDATRLLLTGYGFLLLQHALLFIAPMAMRSFLKMSLGLFLLLYFSVMADWLTGLSVILPAAALILFGMTYYRYDAGQSTDPMQKSSQAIADHSTGPSLS